MNDMEAGNGRCGKPAGSATEVFTAFLKLGASSFGGPIAHLGYFHDEFVTRRRWLGEKEFADLVALAQFLPGPASSQVGFALGLFRAGAAGAAAAWTAFTLPSAILLMLFAYGASGLAGPAGSGILHGLKIVAVAIVAQAVWSMAKSLCPDRERASIALGAVLLAVFVSGSLGQILAILMGGLAGLWLCRAQGEAVSGHLAFPVSPVAGLMALFLFFLVLFGSPVLAAATGTQALAVFDAFYRAGALVFGGGHVVLPLLEAEIVHTGWVPADSFLAGYGAAQAVPGPLFTFAAYLGAIMEPGLEGLAWAALALVAIFLPGLLLLVAVIPFWDRFRTWPAAQAAIRGTNAAVVGILGAALYQPVWVSAITSPRAFVLALACFVFLMVWKCPPWLVVAVSAAGGVLIGL